MAFGSLGRACMALDSDFRVRYASGLFDALLGPGTATRLRGSPVEAILGSEMFGPEGPLRRSLLAGEIREGWRAVLQARGAEARLMSVSAAPLQRDRFGLCGRSQAMARVFGLIDTLQHSESTVLITGESGTGKEVVARIIHAHSPRRAGPFVAVNAAALPGELLESELFGHVRGAFTGAVRDRVGRFEAANDGTLFLDEVGDVPLHLQVKLLRVLQEHTYERVGDSLSRPTTARIIAATNRNLRRSVAEGQFREDLYYRLRVIPVEVPPLRARREDVEPIARLLLSRACTRTGRELRLSPEAVRVLLSYGWPGNVRELENALEFAATVAKGQTIQPEDLPNEVVVDGKAADGPELRGRGSAAPAAVATSGPPRRIRLRGASPTDRDAILAVLEAHAWSRLEAARALGISRSTLWRRMRALGLE